MDIASESVAEQSIEDVKEYYGKTLQTNDDLKTTACCTADALPSYLKEIVADLEDEIVIKYYGCGSPLPVSLEGCTVLDLGCGSGRDVYIASKLVGPDGYVIGIDMTDEQLEVANKYKESQTAKFGYESPNVDFRKGYIEDLKGAGIADNSIDVVISNCVLNLSPDKGKVFEEIFRVLKPGGELFFADVFSSRRIPEDLKFDPVIRGECLGGALYNEDFRRIMSEIGFADYRVLKSSPIEIEDDEIARKLGQISFTSETVRAFKLESLEDRCEDYGQVATYLGGIDESPNAFELDDHHLFEKGRPMLVCGNSAAMVEETRFGKYFRVDGDRSTHFGLFDCEPSPETSEGGGSCC